MPMMPMEPAKAVMAVRPFLVMRLLNERPRAVRKPMDVLRRGRDGVAAASLAGTGSESDTTWPSATSTMRVA